MKIVQHMLGHANFAFTSNTYTTVLTEVAHTAAEATAHLVLEAIRPQPDRPAVEGAA